MSDATPWAFPAVIRCPSCHGAITRIVNVRGRVKGDVVHRQRLCRCGAIVDTVLAYRPKAKSKPARRRKRRAAKIAKEQ